MLQTSTSAPQEIRVVRAAAAIGLLAVSACSAPAAGARVSAPVATPVETAPTAAGPAATRPPVVDGTPALVLEPPEFILTPTPTRISLPLPQERLIIEAPGPGSSVVSPVRVAGWGGPSFQGKLYIRLIGEQGQELARTTTYLLARQDAAGLFVLTVPFTLSGVAEAGLIEVSSYTPSSNRLEHISTRPVVFLSVGPPRVYTNLTSSEKISILSPREDRRVSGGSVTVIGGALLDEDLPLLVEVLDRTGQVIGSTEVRVQAPALGELGTFEAVVTYSVPYSQYGRIAVTEHGLDPPSVRHYTSVRVYLER
jgi:hypothetical protein